MYSQVPLQEYYSWGPVSHIRYVVWDAPRVVPDTGTKPPHDVSPERCHLSKCPVLGPNVDIALCEDVLETSGAPGE